MSLCLKLYYSVFKISIMYIKKRYSFLALLLLSTIIKNYFKFIRYFGSIYRYTFATENTLRKYGNYTISNVKVLKRPLSQRKKRLLDWATFWKFSSQMHIQYNKYNINTWPHHVALVIELQNNEDTVMLMIEKNNTIHITSSFNIHEQDTFYNLNIPKLYTINNVLNDTRERMGDKTYLNWNITNNCQHFILEFVVALNINDGKLVQFTYQPFFDKDIKLSIVSQHIIEFGLYTWNILSILYDYIVRFLQDERYNSFDDTDSYWLVLAFHTAR